MSMSSIYRKCPRPRIASCSSASDRASRWVYVEMLGEKTAANAAAFFQRLIAKALQVQKSLDR